MALNWTAGRGLRADCFRFGHVYLSAQFMFAVFYSIESVWILRQCSGQQVVASLGLTGQSNQNCRCTPATERFSLAEKNELWIKKCAQPGQNMRRRGLMIVIGCSHKINSLFIFQSLRVG
jgi:hypothetical protein